VGVVSLVGFAQPDTRTAIVRRLISWTVECCLAMANPPDVLSHSLRRSLILLISYSPHDMKTMLGKLLYERRMYVD
jgi:hypothetical protein